MNFSHSMVGSLIHDKYKLFITTLHLGDLHSDDIFFFPSDWYAGRAGLVQKCAVNETNTKTAAEHLHW